LANSGHLLAKVIVVPVANPIGLGQVLQASHLGRFHLGTGQNFNRGFADLARDVDVTALLTGEIPAASSHSQQNSRVIFVSQAAAVRAPLLACARLSPRTFSAMRHCGINP
jgi:hypothetical protein